MAKDSSNQKETSKIKTSSDRSSHISLNIIIVVLTLLIMFLVYSLIMQISNSLSREETDPKNVILPSQVQIEVLNGCGVSGVAERFTEFLRERGFDVVNKGNYSSFDIDNTIIIDRSDNPEKSGMVAEAMGVNKKSVVKQFNNQYFLDITIIVGKDYNSLLLNN